MGTYLKAFRFRWAGTRQEWEPSRVGSGPPEARHSVRTDWIGEGSATAETRCSPCLPSAHCPVPTRCIALVVSPSCSAPVPLHILHRWLRFQPLYVALFSLLPDSTLPFPLPLPIQWLIFFIVPCVLLARSFCFYPAPRNGGNRAGNVPLWWQFGK